MTNLETVTFAAGTLMVRDAIFKPSKVVALITVVPFESALTRPDDDTTATLAFELFHVTILLLAFGGSIDGMT